MAALRSVSLTEQPSRKQERTLSYAETDLWHNLGDTVISYLVCAGWAWHAPDKAGNVGNFWSEG